MQHAPHEYQGIMAQIAEAVGHRVRADQLAPLVTTEADDGNGFTFARGNRVVRLVDSPQMHGRIAIFGGHDEPAAVDPNHQFDDEDVERGAHMILNRLNDDKNWT